MVIRGTIGVAISSALMHWQIQTKAPIGMKDIDKIYPNSAVVTPAEKVLLTCLVQKIPQWQGFRLQQLITR